jgi:translocator protein
MKENRRKRGSAAHKTAGARKRARAVMFERLIAAVILIEAAGILASAFAIPSIGSWYSQLIKPSFTPPNWLFGPVWITLYALMGIASYLVYAKGIKKKPVRNSLTVFSGQLGLNVAWSLIFFGLHLVLFSFIEVIVLLITVVFTILLFYKVSKLSAYLLVPYLLWICVAAALNFFIWRLN